jgi:hypothetical protein
MRLILLFAAIVSLNCFGQDLTKKNQTRGNAGKEIPQNIPEDRWLNYATNNFYIKGLFHKKCEIDSQIDVLQNHRREFIAQDHYNTYTNMPYLIIDDDGHSKAYASREAYDNEIIGGLIKLSLSINNEIIKQKELYFASYGSNVEVVPHAKLKPPLELKVLSE